MDRFACSAACSVYVLVEEERPAEKVMDAKADGPMIVQDAACVIACHPDDGTQVQKPRSRYLKKWYYLQRISYRIQFVYDFMCHQSSRMLNCAREIKILSLVQVCKIHTIHKIHAVAVAVLGSNKPTVATSRPPQRQGIMTSGETAHEGGALRRLESAHPTKVRQWLRQTHKSQPSSILALWDAFLHELRVKNSYAPLSASSSNQSGRELALLKTLNLLRHLIGATPWKTASEVLYLLRGLGRELEAACGSKEPAPCNMVRRIMAAVREEATREAQEATLSPTATSQNMATTNEGSDGRMSLQSMLWTLPQQPVTSTNSSSSSSQHHPTHRPMSSRSLGSAPPPTSTTQRQESLAAEEDFKAGREYPASYDAVRPNLKPAVMEAIQEILTDFEEVRKNINEQAAHFVHTGQVILTCGNSLTVEHFIQAAAAAASKSSGGHKSPSSTIFHVIVVASGSHGVDNEEASGLGLASRLAAYAGGHLITTTFIPLSAVVAVMARVHKVILSAHTVLANGGLVSASGSHVVAAAAQALSVPVVCVTGLYNLSPRFPHEGQDTLQELTSPVPGLVSQWEDLAALDNVQLLNPTRDYIEPKLVTLYVTNVGSFKPDFIYRLLAENYHCDDWRSFV
jgi:translation initiation factor eIF-2B subunit beta